ncbi:MAG: hypothetical protein M3010_13580 [Candidatus Dormibacteraeota bacterium]|nr:hypothetical protein [Candidatus Dormibacteraeota bacterium]
MAPLGGALAGFSQVALADCNGQPAPNNRDDIWTNNADGWVHGWLTDNYQCGISGDSPPAEGGAHGNAESSDNWQFVLGQDFRVDQNYGAPVNAGKLYTHARAWTQLSGPDPVYQSDQNGDYSQGSPGNRPVHDMESNSYQNGYTTPYIMYGYRCNNQGGNAGCGSNSQQQVNPQSDVTITGQSASGASWSGYLHDCNKSQGGSNCLTGQFKTGSSSSALDVQSAEARAIEISSALAPGVAGLHATGADYAAGLTTYRDPVSGHLLYSRASAIDAWVVQVAAPDSAWASDVTGWVVVAAVSQPPPAGADLGVASLGQQESLSNGIAIAAMVVSRVGKDVRVTDQSVTYKAPVPLIPNPVAYLFWVQTARKPTVPPI